jgi:hypothetical protein
MVCFPLAPVIFIGSSCGLNLDLVAIDDIH